MSLSDFSELTELSSDEDIPLTQASAAKKRPTPKKTIREYQISHALRPPRTSQYTAKSLYDQIIDDSIILEPEYQRGVVWPESKQSGLIDSILRNYYIPPIIFAVSSSDDGSELRTCIDGKQRLTSIQRFLDGQIPHKDSFTNEKLWYKQNGQPKRKLLPTQYMSKFSNKQIACVEYENLTQDQEREIFQRVQLGVALTPAERMQAITGPWPSLIREISSKALGDEGFEGYLEWGHARGRDFQCLASIAYLIDKLPKYTAPGAPQLEKWLQETRPVPPKFREDLIDTFRIFVALARDQRWSASLNRPTRVSPIEFVMIGVLIYSHRKSLSMTQLSSAIEKLRADVRSKHVDIRSNSKVTKDMLNFITLKVKSINLRSDGNGDQPATGTIVVPQTTKRKRAVVCSDDDDEDEEPKPPRKKSPANPKAHAKTKITKTTSSTPKTSNKAPSSQPSSSQAKTPIPKIQAAPSNSGTSSSRSTPIAKAPPPTQTPRVPIPRPPSKVQVNSGMQSATSTPKVSQTPGPASKLSSTPKAATPTDVQAPRAPMQSTPKSVPVPPRPISAATPSIKTELQTQTSVAPKSIVSPIPPTPSREASSSSLALRDRLAPIRAAKAAIGGQSGSVPQIPSPMTGIEVSRASASRQSPGTGSNISSKVTVDPRRPLPAPPEPSSSGSLQPLQQQVMQPQSLPQVPPHSAPSPAIPSTVLRGQEIDRASIEAILARAGIRQPPPPPAPSNTQQGPQHTQPLVQGNAAANASDHPPRSLPPSNSGTPTLPSFLSSLSQRLGVVQPQPDSQSLDGNGNGAAMAPSHSPRVPMGASALSAPQSPVAPPTAPRQMSGGSITNPSTLNHPLPSRPVLPIQTGPLPPLPNSGSSAGFPPPPTSASSTGSHHEERRGSEYDRRASDHRRTSAPYDRDYYRSEERYSRRRSAAYERDRDRDRETDRDWGRSRDSGWSGRAGRDRDYADKHSRRP